ncbi:sn-glycerol-3-phosphate ABC transporter ATP-binding protein [Marinomonas ushuaiensis DSM 15871]|uniref:sn-glycerol-3-phosphate ABC transporter ATP-binding protein n=1 Tax=Marinomonas ushuaiensis DSM 15871 TaxID=1122207 RepID=X7E727_9GAMM|nr:sn-glycerol-3-phosphate ABC transporter ATP-binding protein UgpC [Marinomonas ushuaiensis]ETX11869.1 sn-glycerol-3-phosphate ABC transporter ATP-binding protein [Marinomonas ushuaiensis DSM 15871]
MAQVKIAQVRKAYGDNEVLHGVDIDIPDGSFTILVGPSGCGKSTLLRMIAGLEAISDGEVIIGDKVVNDISSPERDIAMVFQNYALYPHLTVAQNMGFSLKVAKVPKAEIETKVKDAAKMLGLTEYLNRRPQKLSGGQRQRVAMGRAIVRDPSVFLFDEPLSNLDAKMRGQMRTELRSMHRRLGSTMIYVTHDQIEAMTMADQIVVMNGGYAQQIGAPLDIYDRPQNLFVASFIGAPAMNFLKAKAEGGQVHLTDGTLVDMKVSDTVTGDVIVGVRPEHLTLDPNGALQITVDEVEPTGSETHISATTAAGIAVKLVTAERVSAESGAALKAAYQADKLHLFDAETTNRIETL